MFNLFKRKKKNETEEVILNSLQKDTWMISQGTTTCRSHFTFARNNVQLGFALHKDGDWVFYEAQVDGMPIPHFNSVKALCLQMIEEKYGVIDVAALIRQALV